MRSLAAFAFVLAFASVAHAAEPPVTVPKATEPSTFPVSSPSISPGLLVRHSGHRLFWEPTFARMRLADYILIGTAGAVAIATAIPRPLATGFSGVNGFDEAVRDGLHLRSYQAQLDARDVSDVGLALIASFPILIDSLIVSYWYRGSGDAAFQMALMDSEAFAIAGAVQGAVSLFAGRERPYGRECGGDLSPTNVDCSSPNHYRSFFSGHSMLSFTSAALICSHHQMLHIFESAADPITCGAGFLLAGSIAALRVIGDVHYATDVLIGAAVGTAIGFAVPLLHRNRKKSEPAAVSFVPGPGGIAIGGAF